MSEQLQAVETKEFSQASQRISEVLPDSSDVFLIGEFATAVGMEAKTIRFYEKAGLIKPRRLGRMRVYRKIDVERLKAIKYLRQVGLPIRQIRSLVDEIKDFSMEKLASPSASSLLASHLAEMNRKHQEFESAMKDLSARLGSQNAA